MFRLLFWIGLFNTTKQLKLNFRLNNFSQIEVLSLMHNLDKFTHL